MANPPPCVTPVGFSPPPGGARAAGGRARRGGGAKKNRRPLAGTAVGEDDAERRREGRRSAYFFFAGAFLAAGFLAAGFLAAAFLAGLAATFFTVFLAVAMMYLLLVLVLGLTPDEGLGRGSSDTALIALRERQHSNGPALCKLPLRIGRVFRREIKRI